jgi:hypothetical protein
MPGTVVQSKNANATSVTLDAPATAGNFLIAHYVANRTVSPPTATISGWTGPKATVANGTNWGGNWVFVFQAAGGETTITVTAAGTLAVQLRVTEMAGYSAFVAQSADEIESVATSGTHTCSVTVPAGNHEIWVFADTTGSASTSHSFGGGVTLVHGPEANGIGTLKSSARGDYSGAGTKNPTFTWSGGAATGVSMAASIAFTLALANQSVTDTAAATDAISLQAQVPLTDTAAGTDAITLAAAVPLSDTAAATDAISLQATTSLTDTAVATDAIAVEAQYALDDSAVATDAISVQAFVPPRRRRCSCYR